MMCAAMPNVEPIRRNFVVHIPRVPLSITAKPPSRLSSEIIVGERLHVPRLRR